MNKSALFKKKKNMVIYEIKESQKKKTVLVKYYEKWNK